MAILKYMLQPSKRQTVKLFKKINMVPKNETFDVKTT